MMVDHAITHVGLDAMFGATPVKNPAAIRYMQKLGFSHCGPVENYCSFNGELCACEISWMTREKWERIRPFRVEKRSNLGRAKHIGTIGTRDRTRLAVFSGAGCIKSDPWPDAVDSEPTNSNVPTAATAPTASDPIRARVGFWQSVKGHKGGWTPVDQITQQYSGAKQNILDTTPKGAAQDFALMQLPEQQANATASLLGGEVNQGMNTLLGLGQNAQGALGNISSGLGGLSMQQLGAGLTASGQESGVNQSIMNAQAQQKATTMGFLGQLAGAGGTALGGYFKGQGSGNG